MNNSDSNLKMKVAEIIRRTTERQLPVSVDEGGKYEQQCDVDKLVATTMWDNISNPDYRTNPANKKHSH